MGPLHLSFGATLVACGMVAAGRPARAYHHTRTPSMLHLALWFSLVAGATATTALSLRMGRVPVSWSLLVLEAAISTLGLLFVVYSLLIHE